MPGREEPLIKGGMYHVSNKTIESKNVFNNFELPSLFLNLLGYYRSFKNKISFSAYRKTDILIQKQIEKTLTYRKYFRADIICFCLMPTHFHLLLKQLQDNGISKFVSDVINAFTRFYNIKHQRKGTLFLSVFKSQRIYSREQLIHTSRYIHLNPYSSGIVKSLRDLQIYPWSSLPEYFSSAKKKIANTQYLLDLFNKNVGIFKNFVLNQADYQKNLEKLKYLEKW